MRLDLRAKLALLLAVTITVLTFTHPVANLVVLLLLSALLLALRAPLRRLLPLLLKLSPVIALIVITASLTIGGPMLGATFGLRIIAMVMVTWVVLSEIRLDDLLELAAHWKLPASVSIVVSVAISVIPDLTRQREQINQAQQARGLRPGRGPISWLRTTVAVMIPLLSVALIKAENLGVALSSRGYGAHRTMTAMSDLTWRPRDRAVAWGALLLAAAAVVARIGWGLGSL